MGRRGEASIMVLQRGVQDSRRALEARKEQGEVNKGYI